MARGGLKMDRGTGRPVARRDFLGIFLARDQKYLRGTAIDYRLSRVFVYNSDPVIYLCFFVCVCCVLLLQVK